MSADKKPSGLAGIVAGETTISTVGKEGMGLTYRGFSINDLAEQAEFEEVAFLLLRGHLPNRSELDTYKKTLAANRGLPPRLQAVLEQLPGATHPMDVLRTGCSTLGCIEPETKRHDAMHVANRLLAAFPSMLMYWFHFARSGKRIETQTDDPNMAAHFLHLLLGKTADALRVRTMNASFILYAEHEFNASTFATRVTASTLADFYSAICSGIGTLRGPLHGGANEEAMALIEKFSTPEEAETGILEMLRNKTLIMGFGHRVYKTCDPRNEPIKVRAKKLAEAVGDKKLFPIAERIESVMWREKKLFPNLDFYSALAYHFLPGSDRHVHADFCNCANEWLVGTHHGTAREQSAHPPDRRIHWPRTTTLCATGSTLNLPPPYDGTKRRQGKPRGSNRRGDWRRGGLVCSRDSAGNNDP